MNTTAFRSRSDTGTHAVPLCLNCHRLKDRMPFEGWTNVTAAMVEFSEAFRAMPTSGRLMLGKLVGLLLDTRAELDALRTADRH